MGRAIIKLNDGERDWYLEWSTISDAPVTNGMSLEEMKARQTERYGTAGIEDWEYRVKLLHLVGTTWFGGESVDATIADNRAGDGESCLTKEQLIAKYCHRERAVKP